MQIKVTTNKVDVLQRGTILGGGVKILKKFVRKSTNNVDGLMISQRTNGTNNRDGFILSKMFYEIWYFRAMIISLKFSILKRQSKT